MVRTDNASAMKVSTEKPAVSTVMTTRTPLALCPPTATTELALLLVTVNALLASMDPSATATTPSTVAITELAMLEASANVTTPTLDSSPLKFTKGLPAPWACTLVLSLLLLVLSQFLYSAEALACAAALSSSRRPTRHTSPCCPTHTGIRSLNKQQSFNSPTKIRLIENIVGNPGLGLTCTK